MYRFLVRLMWLSLALPGVAQAYLDAGTGAYVGQLLIMVVTGVVVFVRHPVQTLKSLLSRWRRRGDQ